MRFFLENRGLQVARIVLLVVAEAVIILGLWIAFNIEVISTLPLWIVIAFTIVGTVYRLERR